MDQIVLEADPCQGESAPPPGARGGPKAGEKVNEYLFIKFLGSKDGRELWLASLVYGDAQFRVAVYAPEEAEGGLAVAKVLARMQVPGIVPVLDCFAAGGYAFLVMPCLEGTVLGDLLDANGPLPLEDAMSIAADLANALATAHKGGMVHGNLDLECVLIDRKGKPLLQGFAPLRSHEAKDPGSDLHGLGRILRTMLAGRDLASSPILPSLALQKIRPDIPQSIIGLIERAVVGVGPDRLHTCAEMSLYIELERMAFQIPKRKRLARKPEFVEAVACPSSPTLTISAQEPHIQTAALVLQTDSPPRLDLPQSHSAKAGPQTEPIAEKPDDSMATVSGTPHAQAGPVPPPQASMVEAVPKAPAGTFPSGPVPSRASRIKDLRCERCGKPVNTGAHFCRHCGQKTVLATSRRNSLGMPGTAVSRFCNQCGKPMKDKGPKCGPCSATPNPGGKRHEMSQLPI